MRSKPSWTVLAVIGLLAGCTGAPEGGSLPDHVRLTWLSVTGWLVEAGPTRIVLDGYVGRVDRTSMNEDGSSTALALPDEAMVRRVRDALLTEGGPEWVLVGHAHGDHALDAPAWTEVGGGRLVGAQTVCWQAEALGLPAERCTAVEGGEELTLGDGVSLRVVRWHHSGDSTTVGGRRLRAPLELAARPAPAEGRGLRPGFMEDYPNGGGSRAYLITVQTREGPIRIFWSNTGNPQLWDVAAPADSVYLRENGIPWDGLRWADDGVPVRTRLVEAVRAEGAAEGAGEVDLWLGFGNTEHVRQVSEVLTPQAFIPHHWDNFWTPFEDGVDRAYPGTVLPAHLASEGIAFHAPTQYLDAFRVDRTGVTPLGDRGTRDRLGVPAPPDGG